MGQKINPVGFRTGRFLPWKSRWFVDDKRYKDFLIEDIRLREALMERLKLAGITTVVIERLPKMMIVTLNVSRPGIVIGRGGTGLEDLKKFIVEVISKSRGEKLDDLKIDLKVNEVKNPELSAHLVASRIVYDLERRLKHRIVVSRAMDRVMQSGAKGVKVILSGRIGGVEIARTEKYQKGSIPAQTLREDVDYAQIPALLRRGYVGVKVYITRKEED